MPDKVLASLLAGGWRTLLFEPFRQGIEIHWLLKGGEDGPSVALLNYRPGAGVPRHRHTGLETIMVLEGTQSDENGHYAAGTLVLNPAGTEHSVWTDGGCVVLVQWERPVVILEEDE